MDFKDFFILIYRMMPFIIVSFLVISSLFSGELSGFLLLVGIMISSLITIGISHMDFIKELWNPSTGPNGQMEKMVECTLLTINNSILSYLPLSTHTISFIFGYFIYAIVTNKLVVKNALFIAIITILVFIDVVLQSIKTLPFGSWPTEWSMQNMMVLVSESFQLGLIISIPIFLAYLMFNLIQGFLGRTSPQLNLFSVGFAFTIPLAFFVMTLIIPELKSIVIHALENSLGLVRDGVEMHIGR
jgi:hypothetical protein